MTVIRHSTMLATLLATATLARAEGPRPTDTYLDQAGERWEQGAKRI
jgi:hypothetical protein